MTEFLLKKFVKNYQNTKDTQVREKYGFVAGFCGIIVNSLLFILKFFAASVSGFAISVVADALNNLFDAGSSVVTYVGFKMAGKEQDEEHPFGHGRVEYVSGLIVSFIIIMVGVELFKESVSKIISPTQQTVSVISIVIMAIAIAVKVWLGFFNKKLSKAINSTALNATASDSFCDCIATAAVLFGLVLGVCFGINIDGYIGAVVAAFIIYTGINSAKDTLSPLLGEAPDPEYVEEIEQTVLSHNEILGIHDLVIHDYGPGRKMISLHAEVPSDCDILEMHDSIDLIEMELKQKFSCVATIHMDPIDVNCEATSSLKIEIGTVLRSIDDELTFHDFRIVTGPTHTNLIFDVVMPFKFKMTEDELIQQVKTAVHDINEKYFCVINVDRDFCKPKKESE